MEEARTQVKGLLILAAALAAVSLALTLFDAALKRQLVEELKTAREELSRAEALIRGREELRAPARPGAPRRGGRGVELARFDGQLGCVDHAA